MSIFTNEAYLKKGDKKVTVKFSNGYNEDDDDEYRENDDCFLVCKKCGYKVLGPGSGWKRRLSG